MKTGVARRVPVHPTLAEILGEHREATSPRPDDLIVPNKEERHQDAHRALKAFRRDLKALGLRKRRQTISAGPSSAWLRLMARGGIYSRSSLTGRAATS